MPRPVKNAAGVNRIAAPQFDAVKSGRGRIFDRDPLPHSDCRQHVIGTVERFFLSVVASILVLYLFCFTIFFANAAIKSSGLLLDIHQTNRAVPQLRV